MLNNHEFQAALLSGAAALIMLLAVWWLYLSPMRRPRQSPVGPSPRLATVLAILLGLAGLTWIIGAFWDASMHIKTGRIAAGEDFLWPPHLLLYSGFLLALLVAVSSILLVALPSIRKKEYDPRIWIRRNPFLGAVALASLYELSAIPGDALWHEIFGPDLTAWSPPHVLLGLMSAVVVLCAIGVLLQSRWLPARQLIRDGLVLLLFSLMLHVLLIIAVLEWDLPLRSAAVAERPIWFYPLMAGAAAFFTLVLARRVVNFRWAAVTTAALLFLLRIAITAGLEITDNVAPALPPVFILGAIFMDLLDWDAHPAWSLRGLAVATVFTLGFSLLAIPLINGRTNLPGLDLEQSVIASLGILAASLLLFPLAQFAGQQLAPRKTR